MGKEKCLTWAQFECVSVCNIPSTVGSLLGLDPPSLPCSETRRTSPLLPFRHAFQPSESWHTGQSVDQWHCNLSWSWSTSWCWVIREESARLQASIETGRHVSGACVAVLSGSFVCLIVYVMINVYLTSLYWCGWLRMRRGWKGLFLTTDPAPMVISVVCGSVVMYVIKTARVAVLAGAGSIAPSAAYNLVH